MRDDVRIHKYILDQLGVKAIEYVVGGSLGGMHVGFYFNNKIIFF